MDLFQSHPDNLLPYDGEAFLYPQFYTAAEANHLLGFLQSALPWQQEAFIIRGKKIHFPRLTAWFSDAPTPYTYSSLIHSANPFPPVMAAIKEKVETDLFYSFNSCLANYYRSAGDHMGWHADNEPELGLNPVIASVSFGSPRTFKFRHRNSPRKPISILLTNGSLFVMSGSTQHHWEHALPKSPKPSGPRINLTFRTLI